MSSSGNYALPVTELSSSSDPILVQSTPSSSGSNVGLWVAIGISFFLIVIGIIAVIIFYFRKKRTNTAEVPTSQNLTSSYAGQQI